MRKHTIRIVGGDYRRTQIPVIDAPGLRPTSDRVRETVFNWLQHIWSGDFSQRSCLDLFAGTGALGFEAASRGAQFVQLVEQSPVAAKNLKTLRDKLQATQVRIHVGDAMHVLQRSQMRYDLVFVDPPFGAHWLDKVWPHLNQVLVNNGLIYVESEAAINLPEQFELLRSGKTAHAHFLLAQFAATQEKVNNANNDT
ncbi:16S rRNA (guanine(966)-N(2))-methyltransferase RsmD [Alcaligenes endophyticus]|uniref:16S rRNA (Guanine(966)-N(2))-methyltransferase RsmD n=1 Tax=Alcaligenes endophyticus TaxID=1929088 RepID=A0ABT8EMC1_9BURK|nr:16S rRNA (guanine(966)-N(2))-methyltransferase RsmD [Alcaligenes endophyticus]MCX5590974.1 16S rRNA (guanine(966)-N(2))-methyltransferase RsmD [Alcaligenes endophyticus]MDN4122449.1 16S rRNA (guanine(966)-N(2))-methyltransferase RsmD [Alcaligenes endophyticus]